MSKSNIKIMGINKILSLWRRVPDSLSSKSNGFCVLLAFVCAKIICMLKHIIAAESKSFFILFGFNFFQIYAICF